MNAGRHKPSPLVPDDGIEAGSEMVGLPFHQTQIAIAKSRSGTASWWNEVQSVNVRSMSDWNQQKFDCADLL